MHKIFVIFVIFPALCRASDMMMTTFKGKVLCGNVPAVQALVELRGPMKGMLIGQDVTTTNGEFTIQTQETRFPANIRVTPRNPCKGREFMNQDVQKLSALDENTYTFGKINLADS